VLTLSDRLEAINRLGRAIADPTRSRILLALLDGPAYPAALAQALDLTRPNTSNHLACLRGCGLVVATPQGRQMRYELADPSLARALTDLLAIVLAVDPGEPCAAETP
jgi:DNA-binding transcriptional ArsR family regulator